MHYNSKATEPFVMWWNSWANQAKIEQTRIEASRGCSEKIFDEFCDYTKWNKMKTIRKNISHELTSTAAEKVQIFENESSRYSII